MSEAKLKVDIRRSAIMERLRMHGSVLVAELSADLGATAATIRNDLDAMGREGQLIRIRGGATLPDAAAPKFTFDAEESNIAMLAQKRSIARAIVDLVQDGDTIFINSGTTTLQVAAALKDRNHLNIVTNSVAVAMEMGVLANMHVILLGGKINAERGFTHGADVEEQLSRYHADISVLSIDGITAESGVATCFMEEARIDRIMLERSTQQVIAADHTKVGRTGFYNVRQDINSFVLVTDEGVGAAACEKLKEKGLKIVVAHSPSLPEERERKT